MTTGSHAAPQQPGQAKDGRRRPWTLWRVGTPVMVILSGALFVISADRSAGTDLRPGRYPDLASLVQAESDQYDDLQERVADLTDDVAALSEGVDDREVNRQQRRVESLKDPAGLVARAGPGVTVTLADAPEEVIDGSAYDLNLLVVHQQDIQAVVNAMWKGGAEAVTVQGQRIISTTGIKCEGNVVLLQGVPYAQPYVISAVGDVTEIAGAIDGDPYLATYRDQAANPDIAVGWDLRGEGEVIAPAYDGLMTLSYAEALK